MDHEFEVVIALKCAELWQLYLIVITVTLLIFINCRSNYDSNFAEL